MVLAGVDTVSSWIPWSGTGLRKKATIIVGFSSNRRGANGKGAEQDQDCCSHQKKDRLSEMEICHTQTSDLFAGSHQESLRSIPGWADYVKGVQGGASPDPQFQGPGKTQCERIKPNQPQDRCEG